MPRIDLITLRQGAAAEWTLTNPVLALAEPGYESDTGQVKYGDGVTPWVGLPYYADEGGGGGAAPDEVWVGPSEPPSSATELWYDTDATGTPGGGSGGGAAFDVKEDYGAVGDGAADDTAAIQAAIDAAEAANGGIVFVPEGAYMVTSTLMVPPYVAVQGVGKASFAGRPMVGSRFVSDDDIVIMHFMGSLITDVGFDGYVLGEPWGDNAAAIGLVVGPIHKTTVQRVTARGFRYAGIVLDGTQNSLVEDIDSSENFINIWLTNAVANCIILNANTSDNSDFGGDFITDIAPPNGRQIYIGAHDQPYIPVQAPYGGACSQITFLRGIFERAQMHDYSVELADIWGWIRFTDCHLQGAKQAVFRLAPGLTRHVRPGDVGGDLRQHLR